MWKEVTASGAFTLFKIANIHHGQRFRQSRFEDKLADQWFTCTYQKSYLLIVEALFSKDLKQWSSVAVSSLEHLPDDRQKIPDPLRLSTSEGPQQTSPLGCGWRLRG